MPIHQSIKEGVTNQLFTGMEFSARSSASGRIPRGPDSPDNLECVSTWGTVYSIPNGSVNYNYVKLIIFLW